MNTAQLASTSGATPREIRYWKDQGWLTGTPGEGEGSGTAHQWTAKDERTAKLIVRLKEVGFSTKFAGDTATYLTQLYSGQDSVTLPLGSNITLQMERIWG